MAIMAFLSASAELELPQSVSFPQIIGFQPSEPDRTHPEGILPGRQAVAVSARLGGIDDLSIIP